MVEIGKRENRRAAGGGGAAGGGEHDAIGGSRVDGEGCWEVLWEVEGERKMAPKMYERSKDGQE